MMCIFFLSSTFRVGLYLSIFSHGKVNLVVLGEIKLPAVLKTLGKTKTNYLTNNGNFYMKPILGVTQKLITVEYIDLKFSGNI